MEVDHSEDKRFGCRGVKQRKVIMAMHTLDNFVGHPQTGYLRKSAALLRRTVEPGVSPTRTLIDRFLRMVLTGDGPVFASAAALTEGRLEVRRVGNVLYTRDFAERFLRLLLQLGGRVPACVNSLQTHFQLEGNELGHLMPEHSKTLWPIVADLQLSPDVVAWKAALYARAVARHEHQVLTVDGTMKVTMGVMLRRQALRPLRSSPALEELPEASFDVQEAACADNVAFTVRGMGGSASEHPS